MIAASPNCRSRSSRSARLPQCFASEADRLVDRTVLPVPPLGEKTVTRRPWRPPATCARRPTWHAFLIEKTTLSVSCGRRRTSATSASSASSSRLGEPPDASRMTGARVYSRIAATSFAGSVALPVTKTRTLSRLVSSSCMLICSSLRNERPALAGVEAVEQDRGDPIDVIRAVGSVDDGAKLERPGCDARVALARVPGDEQELLGLAVGDGEEDRELLVDPAGQLAAGRWGGRRFQNLDVAED